jgi:hypothetical protein
MAVVFLYNLNRQCTISFQTIYQPSIELHISIKCYRTHKTIIPTTLWHKTAESYNHLINANILLLLPIATTYKHIKPICFSQHSPNHHNLD